MPLMVMTALRAVDPQRDHRRSFSAPIAAALASLLIAGCAGRGDELRNPGVSDRAPEAPSRPKKTQTPADETWEHASDLSTFKLVDDRILPSRGHNPPFWSGTVRVNDALAGAYFDLGPSSQISAGAVAVESHQGAQGGATPHFVMTKREPGFDPQGGDWEYLIVDTDGRVQSRGVLPLCARCHADAPHDHLFGPRLSSRRHVGASAPSNGEPAIGADPDGALAPPDDAPASKPGAGPKLKPKR